MRQSIIAVLRDLFTGWNAGRLKPLPFALLFAGVMFVTYLTSFAFSDALANPISLDRRGASSATQPLGFLPLGAYHVWVSASLLLVLLAAGANVMAKRFRDMGLPGGLAVSMLAIMLVVLLGGGSTLSWVTNIFIFAVFLTLLTVPTNRLEAGSGLPNPQNRDRDGGPT